MANHVPTCCIVVPVHSEKWTETEGKAVDRCLDKLSQYDFVFVHKRSLDISRILEMNTLNRLKAKSITFIPVDDCWLYSVATYNTLMLSQWFYELFTSWDYMLLFQLDAWILGGDLESWLLRGHSYIGAPWANPLSSQTFSISHGVGNGGLSLRRVQDMLKILGSLRYKLVPVFSPSELASEGLLFQQYLDYHILLRPLVFSKRFGRVLLRSTGHHNTLNYFARVGVNEDFVLSLYAIKVFKWLDLPLVADAAKFSVETNPEYFLGLCGKVTPFGCHGWEKHGRQFYLRRFPDEFSSLGHLEKSRKMLDATRI